MPANLDLATLRSFTLIAQGRTFAEAADAVGRSQSAISLQIQRLEADVGAPLFRRSRQGVELTIAGERFLGFAQRLVQMNDDAVLNMSGQTPCKISFGVTPDFAETVLPDVLQRFRQEHPTVELTLRIDGSKGLVEAVARREVNLAVALHLDDALNQGVIAEAPMLWIGRQGFERRDGASLPLALFEAPCAFRTAALGALGADVPFRIAATSSSLGGIVAAVRTGLCLTVRTQHLLMAGLANLGGSLDLPALPNVTFSYYAYPGEKSVERDTLVEICRRYLGAPAKTAGHDLYDDGQRPPALGEAATRILSPAL